MLVNKTSKMADKAQWVQSGDSLISATLMLRKDGWRLYLEHVTERQTQVSVLEVGNKPDQLCLSSDFGVCFPPHCGHSSIQL